MDILKHYGFVVGPRSTQNSSTVIEDFMRAPTIPNNQNNSDNNLSNNNNNVTSSSTAINPTDTNRNLSNSNSTDIVDIVSIENRQIIDV